MNLAISNLAWAREDEAAIAELMQSLGVRGVELAPTKIWEDPLSVTDSEIAHCRSFWKAHNIDIVSLQSLLFGRPDLVLFAGNETRHAMLDYLTGIIDLASRLRAQVLVFGSPHNRQRLQLSSADAAKIAVPFFRALGEVAENHSVTFCIEPNPPQYGCDWIQTSAEGRALVREVNSPGFGLHLDSGGMTLAGEEPATAITACSNALRHFHISEPRLAAIGSRLSERTDHAAFANALRTIGYSGWTSIEMLPPIKDPIGAVESALRYASDVYCKGDRVKRG